jgi:hypothetical protein
MYIPDGTTILSMRSEDRDKFFSVLRAAYDGKYIHYTGVGKKEFTAKFGILICITPAFEGDSKWNVQLGERFLKFRLEPPILDSAMRQTIEDSENNLSEIKKELAKKMDKFLSNCGTPKRILNNDKLWEYATMLAWLRTPIERDRDGSITSVPTLGESPIRLNKQLSALYTGIAHVTDIQTARRIIRRVTRDSIPLNRIHILESVFSGYNTISKLIEHTNLSRKPLEKIIGDLEILPTRESPKVLSINREIKPVR